MRFPLIGIVLLFVLHLASCEQKINETKYSVTVYQDALIRELLERATVGILLMEQSRGDPDMKAKHFRNVFSCAQNLIAYRDSGMIEKRKFEEIRGNISLIMEFLKKHPQYFDRNDEINRGIGIELWDGRF